MNKLSQNDLLETITDIETAYAREGFISDGRKRTALRQVRQQLIESLAEKPRDRIVREHLERWRVEQGIESSAQEPSEVKNGK